MSICFGLGVRGLWVLIGSCEIERVVACESFLKGEFYNQLAPWVALIFAGRLL